MRIRNSPPPKAAHARNTLSIAIIACLPANGPMTGWPSRRHCSRPGTACKGKIAHSLLYTRAAALVFGIAPRGPPIMERSDPLRPEGENALPAQPAADPNETAKRLMDVLGGVLGLALTLPLAPWIALAIRLDSPGPVLFGQDRVGRGGRRFRLWKFRTMCRDAEARRPDLEGRNEMIGPAFRITDDPRVTRVGRFLRRHNLDEFPQFWNVLRGQMSLVGPRPATPDEVAVYNEWQRRRLAVRPGLTGLAQVRGGGTLRDFDEVVRLDLEYIARRSAGMDLGLILRTLPTLIRGKGRPPAGAR
ncbi:MAG: sugar transferase [Candidatus Brocadiaceae bacterium]|nr:sugar transferase [Candidatus Brocadiaceae bacterium]